MKISRNTIRFISGVLSAVILLTSFTGCTSKENFAQGKKPEITISYVQTGETYDYVMYLREKFSQYNLIVTQAKDVSQVSEDDNGLLLYQTEHNAIADIVLDTNLNKSLPGLTTAFAELSGKAYSANYKTSYLNDAAIDGSVYYFPLYLTIKGIICNKTLFDEKGWKIPANYEEYSQLLTQISEDPDGIRPIYDEKNIKTANYCLNTYYSLNEGTTLAGYQALQDFNKEESPDTALSLEHTLSYMTQLVDAGSLKEEILGVLEETETGVSAGFYSLAQRESAMAFASGATWSVLKKRGYQDEFVMIPVFSEDCPNGYMLEQNTTNIGVSKNAMENPIKSEAIDTIMAYIASEEGQQKLLEISSGVKSPCYGIMDKTNSESMQAAYDALENGRIAQMMEFDDLDETTEAILTEYLFHNGDGHLSELDIRESLQRAKMEQSAETLKKSEVLTTVTADFTTEETKYLFLKAMVQGTGADFALLPQSRSTNYYGTLPKTESLLETIFSGNLTANNIESIIRGNTSVLIYHLTGKQLLNIMDYNTSTFMLYGAKLQYTYNKDKDTYYTTGATLKDGTVLDVNHTYTLAATNHAGLPGDLNGEEQSLTLADAVIQYCSSQNTISPVAPVEAEYIK